MKKLLILILANFLLTACDAGSTPPKLDVKVGGKDSTLNVKSGSVNYGNVISTAPGKANIQTSAHTIYIANYDLDTTSPGWMRSPLTSADQMRVDIQLTGEVGTKDDSPFKVGTYSAQTDTSNGVRFVRLNTFADGKQTETDFSSLMGHGDKKANGEVKITSVTADAVSGEMNFAAASCGVSEEVELFLVELLVL